MAGRTKSVREPTVYGALTFGGGLALDGLGAALHNLPLMYFGYGVLGECCRFQLYGVKTTA